MKVFASGGTLPMIFGAMRAQPEFGPSCGHMLRRRFQMAGKEETIGASVRAKLLNKARAERADFQILLTRYALERLLDRLLGRDRMAAAALAFAVIVGDLRSFLMPLVLVGDFNQICPSGGAWQ